MKKRRRIYFIFLLLIMSIIIPKALAMVGKPVREGYLLYFHFNEDGSFSHWTVCRDHYFFDIVDFGYGWDDDSWIEWLIVNPCFRSN